MRILMDTPVDVGEIHFQPRIGGQTTVYRLDDELREALLDLRQRTKADFDWFSMRGEDGKYFSITGPTRLRDQVSFATDVSTGKIKLFNEVPSSKVTSFSDDAQRAYEAVQRDLRPYTEGMEPNDGSHFVYELDRKYRVGNTVYRLQVDFSGDRKWLITSPEIKLDLVHGKTEYDGLGKPQSHHIQGPFEDANNQYADLAKVVCALLTGKAVTHEQPRNVRMDYGIPTIGVRPILSTELERTVGAFDQFFNTLLNHKAQVYEAVQEIRGRPNLQRAQEFIQQVPSPGGLEGCLA